MNQSFLLKALENRALQFSILVSATSAGVFARAAMSPLQEIMRVSLSLDDNMMALLQGPAMAIPVVIAATPIGIIIDRRSRTTLVLICCACLSAGTVATALASRFEVLFAARCLVGLAGPAIWIAAMSLMADLYQPAQRGRANMAIVVGQCLANSASFALGGVLLDLVAPGPDRWRHALLWMATPIMLITLLTLSMREPTKGKSTVKVPSTAEAYLQLWRYRAIVAPVMLGLSLLGVADGAAVTWVAPALAREYSLAPDRVGSIMGFVLLASGLAGPIVGGVLADLAHRRGGARYTLFAVTGLSFLAAPAGLFASAPSTVSASALLLVFLSAAGAVIVAGTTLLTIVIPGELRGLCMALMSAAFLLLGFGVAPPLVSLLSGALGGPLMIGKALAWVCTSMSCFGAIAFGFAVNRKSPREVTC
jgi:predicted MFS family arabinose efflux permease